MRQDRPGAVTAPHSEPLHEHIVIMIGCHGRDSDFAGVEPPAPAAGGPPGRLEPGAKFKFEHQLGFPSPRPRLGLRFGLRFNRLGGSNSTVSPTGTYVASHESRTRRELESGACRAPAYRRGGARAAVVTARRPTRRLAGARSQPRQPEAARAAARGP